MKKELSELEEAEAEVQFRTDILERLGEIVKLLETLVGEKAEENSESGWDNCGGTEAAT